MVVSVRSYHLQLVLEMFERWELHRTDTFGVWYGKMTRRQTAIKRTKGQTGTLNNLSIEKCLRRSRHADGPLSAIFTVRGKFISIFLHLIFICPWLAWRWTVHVSNDVDQCGVHITQPAKCCAIEAISICFRSFTIRYEKCNFNSHARHETRIKI